LIDRYIDDGWAGRQAGRWIDRWRVAGRRVDRQTDTQMMDGQAGRQMDR
jgi:hypothetical protein